MSFEELRRQKAGSASKRGNLFETDWEVFVIKHDKTSGLYTWFTECCERLAAKIADKELSTASCC